MERVKQCVAACKDDQLADILATASKAAIEAGEILRDLYEKPHDVKYKGAIDLVTEADVASEEKILEILKDAWWVSPLSRPIFIKFKVESILKKPSFNLLKTVRRRLRVS